MAMKLREARALAKQGVHFHLYPVSRNPYNLPFEEAYSEYIDLQNETEGLFHLHQPVDVKTMLYEMRHYDVGLLISSPFIPNDNRLVEGETIGRYRYSAGNKVFDYLDAGLAVMLNYSKFMTWLIKRYNCYVDPYHFLYRNAGEPPVLDLKKLKQWAAYTREMLDVKKQAPRLAKFYESI